MPLKLEPIEKLLRVLRSEDGVPEASQRKPEKCLVVGDEVKAVFISTAFRTDPQS